MKKCYLSILFFVVISGLSVILGGWDQLNRYGIPDLVLRAEARETARLYDGDGDGVPDALDECPDTKGGNRVDDRGCCLDVDGDGVCDDLDICPDTPKGIKVGDLGCPNDTDGDGIEDYLDECPDTPMGAEVNARGCTFVKQPESETYGVCCHVLYNDGTPVELDTDHDRIHDYIDKCLGTPKGAKVDKNGCWLLEEIYFERGVSEIKTEDYSFLDDVAVVMEMNPSLKMEIQGYADSEELKSKNQHLSWERADAAAEYLSQIGIQRNRLNASGAEFSKPVSPDTTPERRAKNRRVNFIPVR